MGIFDRIAGIFKATANEVVDKLEDPEMMARQSIRDQEKHIVTCKEAVQAVIASEKLSKRDYMKAEDELNTWKDRARKAVDSGNDDLARKALLKANEVQGRVDTLKSNWEHLEKEVANVKVALQKAIDQLDDMKRTKDLLISQAKVAKAKKNISEVRAKIGKGGKAGDLLDRMKEKIAREESEADAAAEIADDLDGATSLEKEFENLGSSSSDIEAQLAALKSKA